MAFATSSDSTRRRTSVKIVVAGGFGVGKTTFVSAISEIPPVNTEAWMTQASQNIDPLRPDEAKTKTTVAMDFGRITLSPDLILYLFGTPGQPRFWEMWDDLTRGASAAVVLVDTRRLDVSFPAVNYFQFDADVPYIPVINRFDGRLTHPTEEVREALQLDMAVPLLSCDARDKTSVATTLIAAVEHTHALARSGALATRYPLEERCAEF
jgi:signal recognition particle receptor subunit beta